MDQSSIATRPSFYFLRLRHSAAGYRLIRDAIASPVQAHERRVSHVARRTSLLSFVVTAMRAFGSIKCP
jgi:hypothetical protein